MYIFCFTLLFLLIGSSKAVAPCLGYHDNVGIPEATRILSEELDYFEKNPGSPSIIGGGIVSPYSDPYLAGLVIKLFGSSTSSVCGASLLSNNRLVTAAHCWKDDTQQAMQFEVVLGSQYLFSGGTRIKTSHVITHPDWTPSILENDVAIIYLPRPVSFTNNIRPVSLPSEDQLDDSFVGRWATAVGYGKTTDEQDGVSHDTEISRVVLRVISNSECEEYFDDVSEKNICTSGFGRVGICFGDSGGPLVLKQRGENVLIGVSSFVATRGCEMKMPSAFSRVTSFYEFITDHNM